MTLYPASRVSHFFVDQVISFLYLSLETHLSSPKLSLVRSEGFSRDRRLKGFTPSPRGVGFLVTALFVPLILYLVEWDGVVKFIVGFYQFIYRVGVKDMGIGVRVKV